ncbi:MAG: hypothetical protein RBU30_10230 [Polyangia bacterium]|jgi:hypothetical protein|nr:hypothetical protein [Polyangia bacterium]
MPHFKGWETRISILLGLGLCFLMGQAPAWAQGPGSGDELPSDKPSPQLMKRIYMHSKARQVQERRIKELKSKIEALRTAVPQLQSEAMKEAESYRLAQDRFAAGRRAFKERWDQVLRLFGGKSPLPTATDRFSGFTIQNLYSSDTDDWSRAASRANQADGDDFFIYASIEMPERMVNKDDYAVDWYIRGYDFLGKESTFHANFNWSSSQEFQKTRFKSFRLRRRFSGLGLSPGWYHVSATLKVKGMNWLQRTTHGAIRISQAHPSLSAPPATKYRYKNESKVKLTSLTIRSRGAEKDLFNPRDFFLKGAYKVDPALAGPNAHILVGADVYGTDNTGKLAGGIWRAVFRHRLPLTRSTGTFGSESTTRIKDDIGRGLRNGRYALRSWVLVKTSSFSATHDFDDRYFIVKPEQPKGRR